MRTPASSCDSKESRHIANRILSQSCLFPYSPECIRHPPGEKFPHSHKYSAEGFQFFHRPPYACIAASRIDLDDFMPVRLALISQTQGHPHGISRPFRRPSAHTSRTRQQRCLFLKSHLFQSISCVHFRLIPPQSTQACKNDLAFQAPCFWRFCNVFGAFAMLLALP